MTIADGGGRDGDGVNIQYCTNSRQSTTHVRNINININAETPACSHPIRVCFTDLQTAAAPAP